MKKNNKEPNSEITKKNKWVRNKTSHKADSSVEKITKPTIKNPNFSLEKVSIKKNIKKNILKIDKKIDFHGRGLLEAEEIFSSTISECFNKNKRCLLFVTGKGLFKNKKDEHENKPQLYHGIIRAAFFDWVKSKKFSKHILSFEQASIEHGGDGAFYVYLRKNRS